MTTPIAATENFKARFAALELRRVSTTLESVLFEHSIWNAMETGQMCAIEVFDMLPTLIIKSKVGRIAVTMYFDGSLSYQTEKSVYTCQTWQLAGLDSVRMIDKVEQLAHIFAIPDSYL
jgi:hypothetical protein